MARTWGVTRAKFWAVDAAIAVDNPLTFGGSDYLESVVEGSVNWTRYMSAIGNGSAAFYAVDNWSDFLAPGHICVIEQVTNHSSGAARLLACFIIEEIEPGVQNGLNVINVRGPGMEAQLNKQLVWSPIGSSTTTLTHLAVSASGPSARTLSVGVPAGNDTVQLNTSNSDDIQQEIRITLNSGGVHTTVVTEREQYESAWYLVLRDRMPADADLGNAVEIRHRRIRVDDPGLFQADVVVTVDLANGQTHGTLATGETDSTNRVNLRDSLPSAANENAAVYVTNPFAPTTSDVSQIVAHAPAWGATFQTGTGTAAGSAHRPQGESVFDMLYGLAERTGEFFRQRVLTNPNAPIRSIEWRRTADSSGVTLVMYASDEHARQATDEMSLTKGAVFSLRRRRTLSLLTRVFPAAGDQTITLAACSSAAIAYASARGCSILDGVGLYEPQSVVHDAGAATYGYHEAKVTYGDISITDAENPTAVTAACDQLLISAVQTLVTNQAREYFTVDAYIPVAIAPGQKVKIENVTGTTPEVSTTGDWIVLEVTERQAEGRPRTTLTVSNMSGLRWTSANVLASRLRSVIQSQSRVASGASRSTVVTSSTGGGEGGTTDHGTLLGLGDVEDHPGYLLTSGGRPLAGNMAVNSGVTIDGVDLSAHAANADAHHARVTAADASIVVNASQGVRVSDAFAGDGLGLAGGILSVKVSTALGTKTVSDTLGVDAADSGGLFNGASGLQIKLPTNSGLTLSTAGAALGTPGALTAATTNAVSGTTHTHSVTATDNAKTTPAALLKGSAAGDLTLRYGVADKVTTPLIDTAAGGLRLDPANGVTTNDGNLSFVGARQIDTDTGSLTLSPAATLVISPDDNVMQIGPTTTLKTAHWASGFLGTGWGVTYDGAGDFRSLYADELHVAAFIADTARVAVGAEYITPSMALIARPFTIPAVNATGTLYVEDAPGMDDTAVFAENDWVLLRIISRAGGGLIVANVWGQVTGYQDRADGQQSWVFTTKSTTAAGQVAQTGAIALDFGKPGDGWWWVTTLDQAGSPYAGITTWSGANPYDEGNRVHRLRLGQLRGVSGVNEWGLQAGTSTSSRVRFTDLRNEIHGSRLSLYAGDGGVLQVGAVDVLFYRSGTQSSTLAPDGDGTAVNVTTTAANFFSAVNEGSGSPNYGGNIANTPNMSGALFLSLSNPAAFTSIFRIDIRAGLKSLNISNDTIRIYGQVFQSDEATPLTGEVLLATRTANSTATVTTTAPHEGYATATQAEWNGARLRLRWEYEINANEEAIRLDPGVPSLAVGNPLPTGAQTGGDGLWTGAIDGGYALRIGGALNSAPQLLYNGASGRLAFRNTTGTEMIVLDVDGSAYFSGPMTIGASGGIWQGTGTFASPTTGLKIYNSGGVGRLSTYNGGLEQITLNTSGQLVAGQGALTLDRDGAIFRPDNGFYNSDTTGAFRWLSDAGAFNLAIRGSISDNLNDLSLALRAQGNSTSSAAVEVEAHKNGTIPGIVSLIINGSETHRLDVSSDGIDLISPDKVLVNAPILAATGDTRIGGGLAIGDGALDPLTAVLLMKERTAATTATPADTAQIWVQDVGGTQKLYIKFANGVQRELATA